MSQAQYQVRQWGRTDEQVADRADFNIKPKDEIDYEGNLPPWVTGKGRP